ncbi:MAG: carbohydrate porin, partial [Planctomycetota bacterium]|nr:carbohydrate porin [Planctomycetota bacterium]
GLGVAGAWYIDDRTTLTGVVSVANADRQDFGDIGEGDFYKGIEFAFKVAPKTPKAGYSKFTLWHTDGTSDGKAINGNTGRDGWGWVYKHEQELTEDGRTIMILKYGKSYDDSALYDQQAGASLLLFEPFGPGLQNDLFGAAFNWGDATDGVRDEYNLEFFYRFPVFPLVDLTLSYQWVIDPALDLGIDDASVFSLRIRTTF